MRGDTERSIVNFSNHRRCIFEASSQNHNFPGTIKFPFLHFWQIIFTLGLILSCNIFVRSQSSPDSFEDITRRAEQARKSDQNAQAVEFYRKGVGLKPSWDEGWWYLGTGLYEMNNFAEARTAFEHLTALKPQNGQGWALLGLCEFQSGNYELALQHFEKSEQYGIGDNPSMAAVIYYRSALLLDRAGQFEQARDQLQYFESQGDTSPQILFTAGINALRLPLLPTAVPVEKRVLITKVGQATWRPNNAGHPEQGEQIFQELLATYPNEPNLHYAYGTYLLASDPEKAVKAFAQEININPSNVDARFQLVYLYLKQGATEKGLPLAVEAVKLQPESAMAHNVLGRALLANGQTAEAIAQLKATIHLAPEFAEAHFTLAQAYRSSGKSTEAAKEMTEFEKLKKQSSGSTPTTPQ